MGLARVELCGIKAFFSVMSWMAYGQYKSLIRALCSAARMRLINEIFTLSSILLCYGLSGTILVTIVPDFLVTYLVAAEIYYLTLSACKVVGFLLAFCLFVFGRIVVHFRFLLQPLLLILLV